MFKILKSSLLCLIGIVLQGCATIEYYEFLEPQRSPNQQFIDMPYVYSGLVEIDEQSQNYQFSGVLYDANDTILDIKIPANLAIRSNPQNLVELSNSDFERKLGEPALLVVNPVHPFNLDTIKSQPHAFARQYYLQYQPTILSADGVESAQEHATCPDILLLNIDVYEELPTTLELGRCQSAVLDLVISTGADTAIDSEENTYVWQTINTEYILNNVEHDKIFGYQLGYLGFLLTVPFDVVVSPFYTLGWGLVASKNLLFAVDEHKDEEEAEEDAL